LAKTVIYGLLIATFLTLVVVPVLFYLVSLLKIKLAEKKIIGGAPE
jgi:multidrug efflux pump